MPPNNLNINYDDDEENILYNEKQRLLINDKNSNSTTPNGDENKIIKKKSLISHPYLKQLILLYIVFFLFTMSIFLYNIYIPTMFLDYTLFKFPNDSFDTQNSKAAYYKSFSDALPNLSMFFLGPMVGVLSDKYGRKFVLYVGLIASFIDITSCYISNKTNNLIYYYIFHTIGGINNVIPAVVFAYIADVSEDEFVPILYSFAGVALGVGVVGGPLIFEITGASSISSLTLYVTGGVILVSLIGVIFLPESLEIAKQNNRIKGTINTFNPFKLIYGVLKSSRYIFWVVLVFASINYTAQDLINDFYYYCALVYGWGEEENGYFLAGLGCAIILWGAIIIPILLKFYSERKVVSFGYCCSLFAHVMFVISKRSKYIFLVGSLFGAFAPNNMNIIQSIVSRATPPELQGSVLTGVQSVGALFTFIGSLAANDIFSYFSSTSAIVFFPQAIFLINGSIVFITLIGTLLIWKFYKNPNPLLIK